MLCCAAKNFSAGKKKKKQKVDRVHNYNNVVQTKKEKKMKQKKETHAQSHCERSVAIARLSNRTSDAITTQTSFARNDKRSAFTLAEGATHVGTCDNVRKSAFTLAEVLITLAIIGVVAAMTIPTLIANYKKSIVETKLATFYSTINQAIRLSEVDNGELVTWTYFSEEPIYDEEGIVTGYISSGTLAWFNRYLAPYLKIVKVEEDDLGGVLVYFHDGSLARFHASSTAFYPNASDYSGDLQNDIKKTGKKRFLFLFNHSSNSYFAYHHGKGMEPYMGGWDGTRESLLNHQRIGCSETVSNERAFCTKLIQMNNWKIPNDYPFEF